MVKQEISAQVTEKINAANQKNKNEIVEEFKAQYNGIEVKMQGLKAATDHLKLVMPISRSLSAISKLRHRASLLVFKAHNHALSRLQRKPFLT